MNSKLDKTNQDILVFYFDFNYCWSTCIYHADLASFDRDIWRNTEYIKFNVNISVCILRKIGEIILVTSNHSFRFVLIYDGIPHHTLRFPKFGSQKLTQSFNLSVKNLLKFMNCIGLVPPREKYFRKCQTVVQLKKWSLFNFRFQAAYSTQKLNQQSI